MESKSKTVEMAKAVEAIETYVMTNHGRSMYGVRELLAQKHMLMIKHALPCGGRGLTYWVILIAWVNETLVQCQHQP